MIHLIHLFQFHIFMTTGVLTEDTGQIKGMSTTFFHQQVKVVCRIVIREITGATTL